MTRHGRITIRTADLVDRLHLERSEAYRITARLRVLGLFGIANDRSGARGGRQIWRTTTEREGDSGLDADRHRAAWARITAWARARRRRTLGRLAALRQSRIADASGTVGRSAHGPAVAPPAAGPSFRELMDQAGLSPALVDYWQHRPRRSTP